MNDDVELLRRYIEDKSQAAFTELVHRHIGLVYQTALRRVGGDAHLAEDVSQRVFLALATKASSLRRHRTIAGWLFVSTQHAAAQVVRSEQRRKKWEARAMNEPPANEALPAGDDRLQPVMSDAMLELRGKDRDALMLRFFEQRSFTEIGTALRTSEDAARKRVDRALEKLRALIGRRGVTASTAAMGVALAGFATASAPTKVAASVAHQALAGAATATGTAGAFAVALKALPLAAVVVGGSWLALSQYDAIRKLQAELDALPPDASTSAAIRAENDRLAARLHEVADLRRAVSAAEAQATRLPSPMAAPAAPPRPVLARVQVTPQGTIEWNGTPVTLSDFVARLSAAAQDPRAADARFVVRGLGASFSSLGYVVDEARKAGIPHLVIESDATPDARSGIPTWF